MRRREFLALLGGAAVWPLAARGQQLKAISRIGVLWPNPPASFEPIRQGLRDLGYAEGRNINFEFRWAEGRLDQLPALGAELVALHVDLIITLAPPATLAAKSASQTIPIVFVGIGDPLASGLVSSLAHPGGNLTGTTRMLSEMSVKHVELLKQAVPSLSRLAVLFNPGNSSHEPALKAVATTAQALSVQVRPFQVRGPVEIDAVFAAVRSERADGVLFLGPDLLHPPQTDDGAGEFRTSSRNCQLCRVPETRRPHGLRAEHPG